MINLINLKVTEIDKEENEIRILVEHCSLGLDIYLKDCIRLVNEDNSRFKFEFSRRKRFDNPTESIPLDYFILDENYKTNHKMTQLIKAYS